MITLGLLALSIVTLAEPAWEPVKETGTVRVFAREVAGARVREVKAEIVIAAPPPRVLAVLEDVEHYVEFMPYMTEARVLRRFEGGHIEYQHIDPPFVDERDYAMEMRITTQPDGTILRRWTEANDEAPPPAAGRVRVPVNRGAWTLAPLAGGRTALTYQVFSDPGGSLPAWLVNKANDTSIPDLLVAVGKRAVDPSWKR
jgi:uncharacterized protein YndB with AHSA1/START domain